MIESFLFHDVSVKGPRPVTFQNVPLIVPHMQNNCQKQTHFLNSYSGSGDRPSTGDNI